MGFFDPRTRQLRKILIGIDPVSNDETQNFSFGGNVFFTFHTWEHGACGSVEAFDLANRNYIKVPLAKPGIGDNWKGAPPSNAASICGNLFFHVAADRVVAWKGAE